MYNMERVGPPKTNCKPRTPIIIKRFHVRAEPDAAVSMYRLTLSSVHSGFIVLKQNRRDMQKRVLNTPVTLITRDLYCSEQRTGLETSRPTGAFLFLHHVGC